MKYSFKRHFFARWGSLCWKNIPALLATASITFAGGYARAAVLYVDANANNPVPPYGDWNSAAASIQDAVDAATAGDLVLVTNGVYQTGGRPGDGYSLSNRVVIDKALTVQSVNGPAMTLIEGCQVPGTTNGPSAVRGVYLADGAQLAGFTVEHGATLQLASAVTNADGFGGGVWCQSTNSIVSNCIIVSNACSKYGAGVYSGTLNGCQVGYNSLRSSGSAGAGAVAFSVVTGSTINNNAPIGFGGESGGGAYSCTLSNCIISENLGGGAFRCSLDHCTVANNSNGNGGGTLTCTLNACLICNNQASLSGGGTYDSVMNYCTLSNNWSAGSGGGAYYDFLQTNAPGDNNILIGNACASFGGGLYLTIGSANKNWSITGWSFITNSAVRDGGGFYLTSLASGITNCAFVGNSCGGNGGGFCPSSSGSPIHIRNSTFNGNIAQGNGGGAYNAALDDCFVNENQASSGGGVYGYVSNCVVNGNSAVANGGGVYASIQFPVSPHCQFTNNSAMNGGAAYGGLFTNCVFAGNSASTNGGAVAIAALHHCLVISNQAAFGGGVFAGGSSLQLYPGTQFSYHYCEFTGNSATVDGGGSYTSNSSKGTNCSFIGNSALNNGGGAFGGTFGNGVICKNSANNGGGAYNTLVSNFEVVSNTATGNGGGIYNGGFSYCVISNNIAGTNGGGSYNAGVANSLETRNSAVNGGGAYLGSLNNSTIAGNEATVSAGGVSGGFIISCIVYDNTAPTGSNYTGNPSFGYCCTTPLPPVSNHNITSDPAFIDFAAGNFRLQTNSPCINAGSPGSASVDLDGRKRFVGPTDIGAYEFQGPGVGEFTAWLQQHGLPTNGSADFLDGDADGMNNWQEWMAGTDPTNNSSVLKMTTPAVAEDLTGITLTWQSVSNRTYFLQRADDLSVPSAFATIQSNIVGQVGTTSYTDTNGLGTAPFFYRIGVQ